MMREDWIEVELGNVLLLSSEKHKPEIIEDLFYIGLEHIEKDTGRLTIDVTESTINTIKNKFYTNQILYGKLRPYLNKVYLATQSGVCSTDILVFNVSEATYSKYAFHFMLSRQFVNDMSANTSGVNLPRVSTKYINSYKFPLAPLPEQRAIASKIEQLFSELDNGIANLKTAKSKLEIYRQAILKQAFEGKLTEQWRKKESKIHGNHVNQKNHSTDNLPETWKQVKVGDICECIVPNRDKPKSFNGNIFWITTPDLNEENIHINYSLIDKGLTKDEVIEYKAKVIPINSVIMTCVGKFGVTALIEKESVINQQLHAFLPNDNVVPKYLAYALKTQKDYMHRVSTAITISYLNKSNCNSVPINLPPTIEEQTQIVQEIETRLSVCDKLNEAIEQSLEKAQALRQSILKKAFEGKLLSQDELQTCRQQPDWETAAKLLERVKNKKNK